MIIQKISDKGWKLNQALQKITSLMPDKEIPYGDFDRLLVSLAKGIDENLYLEFKENLVKETSELKRL